jgi:hypothetical protein
MGGLAGRTFPIFFGVSIVLGAASSAFFLLNRNATLKRRIYPAFVIGVGVLFLIFVWLMAVPDDVSFFCVMVPGVVLITLLNIRNTRFCNSCGRTVFTQNPFASPKFCSKCGASLDDGAA